MLNWWTKQLLFETKKGRKLIGLLSNTPYKSGPTEAYVAKSNDFSDWTYTPTDPIGGWSAIFYHKGKYLAVGHATVYANGNPQTPKLYAMTSYDGENWTSTNFPSVSGSYSSELGFVDSWATNGDIVVATGAELGICSSTDLQTWSYYRYGGNYSMGTTDVAYGNGVFVVAAGGVVYKSTDGISWSEISVSSNTGGSICFGNGIFVFFSGSTTNAYYTSTNGSTWTKRTFPVSQSTSSVRFCNGVFLLSCVLTTEDTSATLFRSTDGISWQKLTNISAPIGQLMMSSIVHRSLESYKDNGFILFNSSTGEMSFSEDGLLFESLPSVKAGFLGPLMFLEA